MINIIQHKLRTVTIHTPFKFTCTCGCIYETDEYTVQMEKCPNGKIWFSHSCPECKLPIKVEVTRGTYEKYVQTKTEEILPNT